MNDILLYIRSFAYSHECMLYSNNATMQKTIAPSFVVIVERRSRSLFLTDRRAKCTGMSETGVSSCDTYCREWLTSELCNSKHNLHCILTVTGSQWSSRSAEDVIMQLQVQHRMCWVWTGHQETDKDDVAVVKTGKCESSNQSDSDITSEFLTTDGADESNMFVIYTRYSVALSTLNAKCV